MTNPHHLEFMENLLTDRLYFVEWAHATGLISALARQHPLLSINEMTLSQSLDRAVGYLVQEGISIRTIWSYEDLVTADAFKAIIRNAMMTAPADTRRIMVALLAVAQKWVCVEPHTLNLLKQLANDFDKIRPQRKALSKPTAVRLMSAEKQRSKAKTVPPAKKAKA